LELNAGGTVIVVSIECGKQIAAALVSGRIYKHIDFRNAHWIVLMLVMSNPKEWNIFMLCTVEVRIYNIRPSKGMRIYFSRHSCSRSVDICGCGSCRDRRDM
jgi:hypothetical protein